MANTSLRWIPFFLPTLVIAFSAETSQLTLLLGLAELSGLSTLIAGRWLDARRERLVIITALCAIAAASIIALAGHVAAFFVMAVLLGAGAAYVTVGGHAWISARVPFASRARFIGIYEMSWASALLIGAPIVAVLIDRMGWRAPFIVLAACALLAAYGVSTIDDGELASHLPQTVTDTVDTPPTSLGLDVWVVIGASAMTGMFGLATIVVAGTWLEEELGVSTGGVGLVAMAFGLAELTGSSCSSAFADELGKRRSMQASVMCALVGIAVISLAGQSLPMGAAGLLVFFLGFEYSIVTSFSLISEALPQARGKAIGVGSAIGTLGRGIGVIAAGFLYEAFGIRGPAALSAVTAFGALGFLLAVAKRRPELR